MNCDDVFAILTRGPFPTGSRVDGAVEAHLQICTECRRLAEALRPSDEMLREPIGSDESQSLPGYWGDSLGTPNDLAISPTYRVGYQRRRYRGLRSTNAGRLARGINLWQFTAAVALGVFLAAALGTLEAGRHSTVVINADHFVSGIIDRSKRFPSAAENKALPLFDDLKPECLGEATSSAIVPLSFKEDALSLASVSNTAVQCVETCCTQCHHAGSEIRLSPAAKIRLEHYCSACHHD